MAVLICQRPVKLFHPNRAHLRAIVKRGFSPAKSRDFHLAHKISFSAVLTFAGYPNVRNQRCCWHNSSPDGTSLSFFRHKDTGDWIFFCNKCGIRGDVVDFWYELVISFGGFPPSWSRPQACADLLARVESGEIDVRIKDFKRKGGSHGSRGRPAAAAAHVDVDRDVFCSWDGYWTKLDQLAKQNPGRTIEGRMRLPGAMRISVEDVILGLFPQNKYLMLAKDRGTFHPIKVRDIWLSGFYQGPTLKTCSFVSQNYCCRNDVDRGSYAAFENIPRRWMVIEADQGTLEEQFWLHKQLDPAVICWSGDKSLHGFYWVEGWSAEQCFDLFAEAIRLGVNDAHNWLMFQLCRLPAGLNWKTKEWQNVLVWNL